MLFGAETQRQQNRWALLAMTFNRDGKGRNCFFPPHANFGLQFQMKTVSKIISTCSHTHKQGRRNKSKKRFKRIGSWHKFGMIISCVLFHAKANPVCTLKVFFCFDKCWVWERVSVWWQQVCSCTWKNTQEPLQLCRHAYLDVIHVNGWPTWVCERGKKKKKKWNNRGRLNESRGCLSMVRNCQMLLALWAATLSWSSSYEVSDRGSLCRRVGWLSVPRGKERTCHF